MDNVQSDAFSSNVNTVDEVYQTCSTSDPVTNETTTGYFIASKDDTNFVLIDPRNVANALSNGLCVYYVDEALMDCSSYSGSIITEQNVSGEPQFALHREASNGLVLFHPSDPLSGEFSGTELAGAFTKTITAQPQLQPEASLPSGLSVTHIEGLNNKPFGSIQLSNMPKIVPTSQRFECGVCHHLLAKKRDLVLHMKTHENEKPHLCTYCSMGFNHPENLVIHIALAHTTSDQLTSPYSCPLCPVQTVRYAAFRSHLALHQVDEQVTCQFCNRSFQTQSILKSHQNKHHTDSQTSSRCIIQFHCHLCQMLVYSTGDLMKHYRTSHPGVMRPRQKCRPVSEATAASPPTSTTQTTAMQPTELMPSTGKSALPTGNVPLESSQSFIDATNIRARASKLRAKVYLASLKPRPPKARRVPENLQNSMIAIVDVPQQQLCSLAPTKTDSPNKKRNPRVCPVCSRRFPRPSLVRRHMVRHSSFKAFECLICHSRFARRASANAHLLTHTNATTYFCPFCSREYARRRNLVQHLMRIHPDISVEFVCHSEQQSQSQQPRQEQEQQQHQQHSEAQPQSVENTTMITDTLRLESDPCSSVNFSQLIYTFPQAVDQSVEAASAVDPVCNTRSLGPHSVPYTSFQEPCEIIELGAERNSPVPNKRPFVCSICQKAFASSRTLSVHLLRHSSAPLPYACPHCTCRFTSYAHQQFHTSNCHGRKSRPLRGRLKRHRSLEFHPGDDTEEDGPVKWNAVEHRFHRTKRRLYGPHLCSQCPRRYRHLSHLRAHEREHHDTSLASFVCSLCRRRFVTVAALNRHMSHVHKQVNKTRCVCPICELSFVNISSMRRHLAVHSVDRPYRCAWCLKSFKFHSSCMKHMKTQVCQSRLGVQSENAIVPGVRESHLVEFVHSVDQNTLYSMYPGPVQLPSSQHPSVPSDFASEEPGQPWPDGATKILPMNYPLFPASFNHEPEQIPHAPILDHGQAHVEPDGSLTWPNPEDVTIVIDPVSAVHSNQFLLEPLPALNQNTNLFESTVPPTGVTVDSTDTHGYTNLLMSSEFVPDSTRISHPVNPHTWSYIANIHPVSTETSCEQLTELVELPPQSHSDKPCMNLISTDLIEGVLHQHAIPDVNEESALHLSQPADALAQPPDDSDPIREPRDLEAHEITKSTVDADVSFSSSPPPPPVYPSAPLEEINKEKHREAAFGCAMCHRSFTDAEALLLHSHTTHPVMEKEHVCDLCNVAFANHLLLEAHRRTHTHATANALACPLCPSAVFGNQSGLSRHINSCHPRPDSQRYRCTRCSSRFYQLRQLLGHVNASSCAQSKVNSNKNPETEPKGRSPRERFTRRGEVLPLKKKDVLSLAQCKPSDNLSLSEKYLIKAAVEVVQDTNGQTNPDHVNASTDSTAIILATDSIPRPHVCSMCPRSFRLASDLKRHMCHHTGDRPFKCTHCDRQYVKHCQLRRHCLRVHRDASISVQPTDCPNREEKTRFSCHICHRLFKDKYNLLRHIRLHASHRRFVCPHCHSVFDTAAKRRKHVLQCSQPKPGENIPTETKTMSFLDQLRTDTYHSENEEPNRTQENNQVKLSSEHFLLGTSEVHVVDLDELSTQNGVQMPTEMSPMKSGPEVPVPSHVELLNRNERNEEPVNTSIDQRLEMVTPLNVQPYENQGVSIPIWLEPKFSDDQTSAGFVQVTRCVNCTEQFPDITSYNKHICANPAVVHHPSAVGSSTEPSKPNRNNQPLQPLYKCAQCDRLFSHLGTLRRHEATHETHGGYSCTMCGSIFTKQSSLTAHERIHLNLKPFHCPHCGKHFRQRSNMRRHVRSIHS